MTHFLTDPQYATLVALCDALVPAVEPPDGANHDFWKRTASNLGVPRLVTRAVRDLQSAEQQAEFKQLLDALNQPLTAGLLTGHIKPFVQLSAEQREKVLQNWAASPLPQLRRAFQAIKRLTTGLFYSALDEAGRNPNWAALNYQPPLVPPAKVPKLSAAILHLQNETELECEAVIIGSGAGGGVVAAELARAGKSVIVVEKGGYASEEDFDGVEFTAYEKLYENQAVLATRDLGVIVLAGSTLGGGTVINWAASFRTPEHVREEWEREYACSEFTAPAFNAALDSVSARLGVSEAEAWPSKQAQVLERACDRLGLGCGVIPQNRTGCEAPDECGWCCFGCARGAKQSTPRTYLQEAAQHGARFLVNTHAEKILFENGRVVGVQVNVAGRPLTIRARATVLAAGSLHSPALLLRSGLTNPNIGANLRLHPTFPIFGDYAEAIEPWRGPMLTRYVPHLNNLDGQHYGVVIEHPPAHPSLIGLGLPWLNGAQHKASVLRAAHRAIFIVITRDRDGGRVTVDKQGRPVLHYALSKVDGQHLMCGVQESFRLHQAAGATEIGGTHSALEPFRTGDLEAYLQKLGRLGWRTNGYNLFSAHQMGTCRMGGRRSQSVLTPQGEVWEARNLFVADASTFPTASGVNPMLTIMAVAHLTAQAVKARL